MRMPSDFLITNLKYNIMPIIKKNDVTPSRPVILVLYGTPGCGKTSLATTAKNPLIIDTDRGYDRAVQRVDTLSASTWADIQSAEPEFASYDTIIIDTAKAMLDDFLMWYAVQQDPRLERNSLKRFGKMADDFKAFLSRLQSLDKDIVFICHDKETAEGDVVKHAPDCTGQSKGLLLQKSDQVGYVSIVGGQRTLSFEPTDNFIGKNVAKIEAQPIPDATDKEFPTFLATVIDKVRAAIQGHSEEQQRANAQLAKLREQLDAVATDEDAEALMDACKELPKSLKTPFFALDIKPTLTERGFVYEGKKFTLKKDSE